MASWAASEIQLEESMKQELPSEGSHNHEAESQAQNEQQIFQYMNEQFDALQNNSMEAEKAVAHLQQQQESFVLKQQQSCEITAEFHRVMNMQGQQNGHTMNANEQQLKLQQQRIETELNQRYQELGCVRKSFIEKCSETWDIASSLLSVIIDNKLVNWKMQQQKGGTNIGSSEAQLDQLQQWCEKLAEGILYNRQQLRRLDYLFQQVPIELPLGQQDMFDRVFKGFTALFERLIMNSFVIEKQPPQVLKKDARFTASVRMLVGGKIDLQLDLPTVKCSILSDDQARNMVQNGGDVRNQVSGEILNNIGLMEHHQTSDRLSVTFRNMQLKKIKRSEKKGNETVTEEKFSILFQSCLSIGGGDFVFNLWTLSLPVVVTVHGNQECNAVATILWDNSFAEPYRCLFQVPDKKPWPDVAKALHDKFTVAIGRGFLPNNLNYLASKLFGHASNYSNSMVTWSKFNKEPFPGRNFTFWEWFYAILKITKEWLSATWKDSLIIGFISKAQAQDMLLNKCIGTFLLRFSDSELGGITIAWVGEDPNKPGERQVWNLAPFTEKDFKIRGLGDRIRDLQHLTYLYPNFPKAKVFGHHWTSPEEPTSQTDFGYVKPDLTTIIPGIPAAPLNEGLTGSIDSSSYFDEYNTKKKEQNQESIEMFVSHHHDLQDVNM